MPGPAGKRKHSALSVAVTPCSPAQAESASRGTRTVEVSWPPLELLIGYRKRGRLSADRTRARIRHKVFAGWLIMRGDAHSSRDEQIMTLRLELARRPTSAMRPQFHRFGLSPSNIAQKPRSRKREDAVESQVRHRRLPATLWTNRQTPTNGASRVSGWSGSRQPEQTHARIASSAPPRPAAHLFGSKTFSLKPQAEQT
jgi:hypothetical protein